METSVGALSTVEVEYCGSDDGGRVSVGMLTGKKKQSYKFLVVNWAYSINIDSEIELKNDGGRGLGVASGGGRSGDGMWYGVFDQRGQLGLKDAGLDVPLREVRALLDANRDGQL